MKKVKIILMLLICLFLSTCNDKGSNTTNTYNTTSDNTTTTTTSGSVFIYAYSTSGEYAYNAHKVVNTCYGTNSSGYTSAPFYSTSTHDLKDRLPSSKWSNAVYSLQGHKISSSWESLWDGNIDMSLHQAEVIYDNYSTNSAASGGTGFWTGTKSDGTFSGYSCSDWSSYSTSDNATWGSFLIKDSSLWIDNGTSTTCNTNKHFLCFMYN